MGEQVCLVELLNLLCLGSVCPSLPKVLKEGIPKEGVEKIKKAFEAHRAVVVLE